MTSFDEKPSRKRLVTIWLIGAVTPWALYSLVKLIMNLTQ